MSVPYLSCKDIEIKFGYESIIRNVNLSLNAFEKIALVGVNGCGKTSLLRVLAGLAKPYSGQVYCREEQIWPTSQSSSEHFCLFLSSQPSLLLDHSVLWNIDYYTGCYGIKNSTEDCHAALKKVGLGEKHKLPARLLSTGQKRRLTLAAIILIKPKIILADEPTNGLDDEGMQLCLEIFDELIVKNQSGILVASHEKAIINWCDNKLNLEKFITKTVQNIGKIGELF